MKRQPTNSNERRAIEHPPHDPEYKGEYVELESAWASYLGRDLATWLGVPHVDQSGCLTKTRQFEVRARIHAFAGDLAAGPPEGPSTPAICALGSYDDQDLSLLSAPDSVESGAGVVTLRIAWRGSARERVMKRGTLAQVTRYLRHVITPRRLLAAGQGGY